VGQGNRETIFCAGARLAKVFYGKVAKMRRLFGISVVTIGVIVMASVGSAEEAGSEKLIYVGGTVGWVVSEDLESYDRTFHDSLSDLDLSSGFMLGVRLGHTPRISNRTTPIAVELEGSMITSSDAKNDFYLPSPFGSSVGFTADVSVKSIMANFLLRYPYGRIHPYGGFGLGWTWFDMDDVRFSLEAGYAWPDTGTSLKSGGDLNDNTFAYQFLLGASFDLTDTISMDLGYRYFRTEPEFKFRGLGFTQYEAQVDLDVRMTYTIHVIGLGLTFWF
jgi:opacity protein-like surface antigen